MKRTLTLLLIFLLCLSFIACAASPTPTDSPAQTSSSENSQTQRVSFPLKEEFTLHINYDFPAPEGVDMQKALEANPLYQELHRLTNVKVQINYFGNKGLSSMVQPSPPPGITIGSDSQIQSLISIDGIIPLDAYIDNPALMPNLHQQVFANLPQLRGTMTELDGHIYALPGYDSDPLPNMENYLWINKTWLDRANLEIPTTFEALEAALSYFAANDMNENGSTDDEIPFYPGTQKKMELEGLMGIWGIPVSSFGSNIRSLTRLMYVENGQVQYVNHQQFQQFIAAMKRWYDNGILCQGIGDQMNYDSEPVLSDAVEGAVQVGAFLAPNLNGIRGSEEYICITPPGADGNTVRWYQKPSAMGELGNLCLMKNCQQPEIILAWLDLFYDPHITLRYCCGENNDFSRKEIPLQEILPHLPYAKNAKFYETYERTNQEKTMMANWELYKDVVTSEPLPNLKFDHDDSGKINDASADISTLFTRTLYLCVTNIGDVESDWESYQKSLKQVRIEDYVRIVQESYDAWLAEKAG